MSLFQITRTDIKNEFLLKDHELDQVILFHNSQLRIILTEKI